MPAEAWRLFLALWPSPAVRERLVTLQHDWQWAPSAAVVEPGQLHVTLHFIGAVATDRTGELQRALQVPFEPFTLDSEGARAEVWGGGIAVLELDPPPALLGLRAALAGSLRAFGLPVDERAWRPHVTFARKAPGARPPSTIGSLEWTVDDGYALVRSVPGNGYAIVHRYR